MKIDTSNGQPDYTSFLLVWPGTNRTLKRSSLTEMEPDPISFINMATAPAAMAEVGMAVVVTVIDNPE